MQSTRPRLLAAAAGVWLTVPGAVTAQERLDRDSVEERPPRSADETPDVLLN